MMRLTRRRFLGSLAGAVCGVLGAVYGAPTGRGVDDYLGSAFDPNRCYTDEFGIPSRFYLDLVVSRPAEAFRLTGLGLE